MRGDFAFPDVIVNGCKPLIYLFVVGNKALYAGLQIGRKLPLKQPQLCLLGENLIFQIMAESTRYRFAGVDFVPELHLGKKLIGSVP